MGMGGVGFFPVYVLVVVVFAFLFWVVFQLQLAWEDGAQQELELKERKRYLKAVEEMLARTSSEYAPWTLVPATDQQWANVVVYETVIARLEPLHQDEPMEGLDEAKKLVAALGEKYPALGLTTIPGRLAVGELKRRWDPTLEADDRTPPDAAAFT